MQTTTRLKIFQKPAVADSLIRHAYAMDVPILLAKFPTQVSFLESSDSSRSPLAMAISKHVRDLEELLAAAIRVKPLHLHTCGADRV